MDRDTRPIPGITLDVDSWIIQRISYEEANKVADTWIHDPDIWWRDLSATLHLMINASMPPAGRYIKRDWVNARTFPEKQKVLDIIETVGLGNFGGPPSSMPKHRYSWAARDLLRWRSGMALGSPIIGPGGSDQVEAQTA